MSQTFKQGLARVTEPPTREKKKIGVIFSVDYVTRHVSVRLKAHGFLSNVRVAKGIPMGTEEKPRVWRGNFVELEKDGKGRWVATKYIARNECMVPPPVADPDGASFDVSVQIPEQDSFTDSPFPDLVTPDLTFEPPTFKFGSFSPEGLTPRQQICGIPICCESGPPTDGMTLLYDADDGCLKWGFRCAPLQVRWNGAVADAHAYIETHAVAVAVNGAYAYVAVRQDDGTIGLLTYDLTDPTAPDLTDTQSLTATTPDDFYGMVGIETWGDYLWVWGQGYDDNNPPLAPAVGARRIHCFDISTRTAPSETTSWETNLTMNLTVFRHYDTGSETFTGNPYLVGANEWNPFVTSDTFIVNDGTDGTEVQTLTGYQFGKVQAGVSTSAFDAPAVICDNVALIPIYDTPAVPASPDESEVKVLALDLSAIPSGAIAVLWEDENVRQAEVYLGANRAYAREWIGDNGEGYRYYSQVDVDATSTPIDSNEMKSVDDGSLPYGYFLDGTCLKRVYWDGSYGTTVRNISDPHLTSEAYSPYPFGDEGLAECRQADADMDQDTQTIFGCAVGKVDEGGGVYKFYLTVYST